MTCVKRTPPDPMQLTQINNQIVGSHRISTGLCNESESDVRLKRAERMDCRRSKVMCRGLLNTTSEGIFDASKNRAEALADQIKAH